MTNKAQRFLEVALKAGALQFGRFQLKSGRISPYFFNLGMLHSGKALQLIGDCYAEAVINSKIAFDLLFGPAYKGIPIVSVTAASLMRNFAVNASIAFNRKEQKQHGEGGAIIGAPLAGKVLVLDDVMTAGTAVRESFAQINKAGAEIAGVIIAFDRQEKGNDSDCSIVETLKLKCDIPVVSIVTFKQLVCWLKTRPEYANRLADLESYRKTYGA